HENFLDHYPGLRRCIMKTLQVRGRIAKTIDVIYPDPVDETLGGPAQRQRVDLVKDRLSLGAQAYQSVDIEEAPVPEVALRGTPKGEPVILPLQQLVEQTGIGIDFGNHAVNGASDDFMFGNKVGEHEFKQLLVTMPPADVFVVGGGRQRKVGKPLRDEAEHLG